jgi:phosphopantothenoylcysteine decarboxylase
VSYSWRTTVLFLSTPAIDVMLRLSPGLRVCLGVSGSVAAVKTPEICIALLQQGVSVDVVLTESAVKLLRATYRGAQPWEQLTALAAQYAAAGAGTADAAVSGDRPTLQIYRDSDEWESYGDVGSDPVLHVELAKRNSLLLIAPLCANTLASCALGLCGSLLLSVVRAWYYDLEDHFAQPIKAGYGAHAAAKSFAVAPAMNTFMWHQRVTAEHLGVLRRRGVAVIPPVSKRLACGDCGMGAMADVESVVEEALGLLHAHAEACQAARRAGLPVFAP